MTQYRGTVAWFYSIKGFGFIKSSGGPDVFVHFSAIQESGSKALKEGETVQFNVTSSPKGRMQAANVFRAP